MKALLDEDTEPRRLLTRKDWIRAATELMVNGSVESVKLARLALDLRTTKGSFYWHFRSRDDLLRGVLEAWTKEATLDVEGRLASRTPSASERLLLILRLPLKSQRALRAADLETAILCWARRSQMVREAVAKVDVHRIQNISSLLAQLGLSDQEAELRSHMAYSFLRYIAQRCDMTVSERTQLSTLVHTVLVNPAPMILPLKMPSTITRLRKR